MPQLKLGKKPARLGAIKFKFSKYANLSVLPAPPHNFGFDDYLTEPFGMLGNDEVGDCVEAGAAHETMVWCAEAGVQVPFNSRCVISDYSAATGYNPNIPGSDQGTDMVQYASYRRKTGIIDENGKRHKIGAYVEIEPGNIEELLAATWVFGAVGIGIRFPQSAMMQFNAGEPWKVVHGSPIEGGHYIPMIRHRGPGVWPPLNFIITWGARQGIGNEFIQEYMDEGIAYLSAEMLTNGLTVNGFDIDQLNADLAALPG